MGLRLRFPLTFGFYDFKPPDILEGKFPESLATVTFVGGVEVELPVKRNWIFTPFGEVGVGKDLGQFGEFAWVTSIGIRSRAEFPWKSLLITLGNEFRWAASARFDGGFDTGFLRIQNGVDIVLPPRVRFLGRQTFFTTYYANYFYSDDLEFPKFDGKFLNLSAENEIGVSIGAVRQWQWWKVKIDRFGIGVRFGQNLTAVRVFIGLPFR